MMKNMLCCSFTSSVGELETWETDQHRELDWIETQTVRYELYKVEILRDKTKFFNSIYIYIRGFPKAR